MTEETITFELIRKIQLEEQKLPTLTRLPTNFFNSVSNYLEQKKKVIANDDRKSSLELRNVERLVEDIINRRERKILNAAIIAARSGLSPENLDDDERSFYSSVLILIKNRRKESSNIFVGKSEPSQPTVMFREDTPEFLGMDEKTYGPFRKGDMTTLPDENMKILLERGIVEKVK